MSAKFRATILIPLAVLSLLSFLVEAGSAKKVAEPGKDLTKIKHGKQLFDRMNCVTCHSVGNAGGCLGPPLDGVGRHRSKEFLLARITDSASAINDFERLTAGRPELMPHPRLPPSQSNPLVAYLLSLPEAQQGYQATAHDHAGRTRAGQNEPAWNGGSPDQPAAKRSGQYLFYHSGCAACHAVGDIGGHIGPSLDGVGSRLRTDEIIGHMTGATLLTKPVHDRGKQSEMPAGIVTPAEARKIAEFLMKQPAGGAGLQ